MDGIKYMVDGVLWSRADVRLAGLETGKRGEWLRLALAEGHGTEKGEWVNVWVWYGGIMPSSTGGEGRKVEARPVREEERSNSAEGLGEYKEWKMEDKRIAGEGKKVESSSREDKGQKKEVVAGRTRKKRQTRKNRQADK